MIQITGLTKVHRGGGPPVLLDLTFEARPGAVTALLGPEGAGKSTALRLMLELERGRGVTLFDGRTYRRLRRPEREVGVVLSGPGDVPGAADRAGHPGRKARGHLRMLAAAVGAPVRRADELLERTRLAAVAGQRLRTYSPGMHRRLALAAALLGEPGTLLLDAPTEGLSPRNVEWFHAFLRSFAADGGTVLVTTRTPQEASQLADRVVTLDRGRMAADQSVTEFRRTRLSPEVAVRGPQMARLADLLAGQGAQVRRDGGTELAVSGVGRTEIGELAYRHGILLHELADRVVERPAPRADLRVVASGPGRPRTPEAADAPVAPTATAAPVPEDAVAVTAGQNEQNGQAEPADRTVAMPVARPRAMAAAARDLEPAPTLALPVAPPPAGGSSAVAAPAAPGPRRGARAVTRRAAEAAGVPAGTARTGRRGGGRREDETSPVVAVDRLFRDGLTSLARSAQAPAAAPKAEAHERPGEAADGLLGDDTVRLGRVARPQPDRPASPGANPTGADPTGPVVPVTSDLRSE
ncbi:ATP-binding cassette domain-containing protein [Kitasatospora purpeofusca]|uniref:ATP-binding cassette domain-containing protein n=1 Tax=Kitasatospora purpeofusca TaxID=67352 RepID=A0ABZ1TYC5_9ACTN|nr:ATP-binding cassette domain-containing protein [Kitasatospora purpeofusca]